MAKDYSAIINHPHHRSETHPPMSMSSRASHFSPFAALVGYDDAVAETQRLTREKLMLDESAIAEINRTLGLIEIHPEQEVLLTYFVPDMFKEGGEYVTVAGKLSRIDRVRQEVTLANGTVVPMDDIYELICD